MAISAVVIMIEFWISKYMILTNEFIDTNGKKIALSGNHCHGTKEQEILISNIKILINIQKIYLHKQLLKKLKK